MDAMQKKTLAYRFFFIVGVYVLLLILFLIWHEHDAGMLAMFLAFTWPVSLPVTITVILLSVFATIFALTTKPRDRYLVFLAKVTIPYEIFALATLSASVGSIFPLSEFLSNDAVGDAAELVSMAYAITSITLAYLRLTNKIKG